MAAASSTLFKRPPKTGDCARVAIFAPGGRTSTYPKIWTTPSSNRFAVTLEDRRLAKTLNGVYGGSKANPSTLFGQFGDEQITAVGRELDAELERALRRAAE